LSVAVPLIAPSLHSDQVMLTQLEDIYFEDYCKLIADPISQHWTVTTATFSDEQLLAWLRSRPGQLERLDWAILNSETGEFLGEIVLNELDAQAKSMNLRIALLSARLGQGVGTKAVKLVIDYGFQVLGLSRITLDVWSKNQRAIRVYEKVGFAQSSTIYEDGKEFLVMQIANPTS
jgi:RimJ/RimL family protein N-acetyltransferase